MALRKALRLTEAKFARAVGVSPRTVANWHANPATVPRNDAQDKLDELLAGASPAVLARLGQLTGQQPPAPPAPGDAAGGGQVVSLGSHPRYRADFRALASGQLAAARAAMGLTLAEFAALIADVVGWNVMPATVGRWETESAPPGDVVLFAQAYLAGPR